MKIAGQVKYKANFVVDVDISVEEFEALSEREQNKLLESHIDIDKVDFYDTEIDDEIDY